MIRQPLACLDVSARALEFSFQNFSEFLVKKNSIAFVNVYARIERDRAFFFFFSFYRIIDKKISYSKPSINFASPSDFALRILIAV